MRLSLSKHGGLAAGVFMHQPPVVADTKDLPPGAAAHLESMVEEAKKSALPDSPPPEPHPDAMSYTITIDHGGSTLTLRGSDQRMSPAFRLLLDWLERHKRGG